MWPLTGGESVTKNRPRNYRRDGKELYKGVKQQLCCVYRLKVIHDYSGERWTIKERKHGTSSCEKYVWNEKFPRLAHECIRQYQRPINK